MTDDLSPAKADAYRHPGGTVEIVFAVEDGTVLTFREYHSVESFQRAVGEATYEGRHPGVESLPDVEAFRDEATGNSETGTDGRGTE
jgi:hypothetical protein